MQKQLKQSQGTVSITATKDGRHEYCFSNQMSSIADKIVRYALTRTAHAAATDTFANAASTFTVSFTSTKMVTASATYIPKSED